MKISTFILKRLVYSIFVVIGFSILIFILCRAVPGDPVRLALGERAPEWVVEKLRIEMHLNEPIYMQYYYWLKGVLMGDLGISLTTKRAVIDDIRLFFPVTLELTIYSGILLLIFSTILGTVSGWHNNTWIDNVARMVTYVGVVTPSFIFAIFFVFLLSYILKILPTMGRLSMGLNFPPCVTGLITIDALIIGDFRIFFDALKHILLPALSLMMVPMAQTAKIIRSSIIDNLQKDYIMAERSYGIPNRVIMFKFLLKPSFIPGISIAGMCIAGMIADAFIIETIFNFPGIARYGLNAMLRKDVNSIIAVTMISAFIFTMVNIIIDVIVNALDPRIELGIGKGE